MTWRSLSIQLLCVALAGSASAACDRKPLASRTQDGAAVASAEKAPAVQPSKAASPQPAAPSIDAGAKASSRADYKLSGAARLVAIGDLHGDLSATKQALELGGAIDSSGSWVGGELTVVQTGDQFDRGDDEQEILELFERVGAQAKAAGGRVVLLNGNHETMNGLGDYRYVTRGALSDFHGLSPISPFAGSVAEPYRARAEALLPGGAIARQFAQRPVIVQVGDTVFAHGGVTPPHVRYGVDRLNREVSEFFLGQRKRPPAPMVSPDGPLWTRIYGSPDVRPEDCATLQETLRMLSAERLVIGHTVQEDGISHACREQVYRIDVGLSHYYGGSRIEVLELTNEGVKRLSAPRR